MLETGVILTFAIMLIAGMLIQLPLYITLAGGFVLFFGYGLIKKHKIKDLLKMSIQGFGDISPILLLFVVIGILTAIWRACGTIPAITAWSSHVINPSSLLLLSFILCSIMSFLTGSALATGATIGVICATIGNAMGANPMLVGGAILSGAFFGDRCSPLSSVANLIAGITETSLFFNLKRLFKNAIVPLIVTILLYLGLGFLYTSAGEAPDFESVFAPSFNLSWLVILPTVIIIVLSIVKVPVKTTMLASAFVGLILCLALQDVNIQEIPKLLIFGFESNNPEIASMVDGGGIISMVPIGLIVAIASTYSGLFEGTELLDTIRVRIKQLACRTTPFSGVLATSILTNVITCDQLLSVMLTKQLCDELEYGGEALALDLGNSAGIVCGCIPWSTMCVPILAFIGTPATSCLAAFYVMLVPLWFLFLSFHLKHHPEFIHSTFGKLVGFMEYDDARRFINCPAK